MGIAERLEELQTTDFWPDPDFTAAQGGEVWAALVAIVQGAEQLPELFDVIEGSTIRTLSFVPLLDVLNAALDER